MCMFIPNIENRITVIETKGLLTEIENTIKSISINLREDSLRDLGDELFYVEKLIESIKGKVEVYNVKYNLEQIEKGESDIY